MQRSHAFALQARNFDFTGQLTEMIFILLVVFAMKRCL